VRDTDDGLEKLAQVTEWRDSSVFSPAEHVALELAAAVAFENFRSKFNPVFGIESQGMCLLPD
tara:strand:+ start:271 stop:459 length:189 start_codon:yes stop_codon:yes gene_type:complete